MRQRKDPFDLTSMRLKEITAPSAWTTDDGALLFEVTKKRDGLSLAFSTCKQPLF
jgi:hypothetical protein